MSALKRQGRGKSKASLQLIDAAIRILEEIQPASVRAVCYRLFVEKLIGVISVFEQNLKSPAKNQVISIT